MTRRHTPRRAARIAAVLGLATVAAVAALGRSAAAGEKPAKETATVATDTHYKHTNRLINATSPYLLQHAHNPVDWYEWGDAAFAKAKAEDKPVFLSIGYSSCHWCHVMEHESFEHEDVAAVMNANFVCIKVDREERPDIDEIYMAYTQATTHRGGWPMTVWLTPDGSPFHAGTYFPKQQLVQILNSIAQTWATDRDKITSGSQQAKDFFSRWASVNPPAEGVISKDTVEAVATTIAGYFDRSKGGLGRTGNKFPPSMAMDLLLRQHRRSGSASLLQAVDVTLDNMARGGIYDHIGGGICRYSTDPEWLVPHFEKMLYDQGLVSAIYLDGFQVTKNAEYARVAADIFDYCIADLQAPEGGFYSARDADSGGLEGAFYIWTIEQVRSVLGDSEAKLFNEYYDVTAKGNWFESRGHAPAGPKNILRVKTAPAEFAKLHGLDVIDLKRKIGEWRGKLATVRAKRVAPALDDKILTAWNGLIIASMAKGARVLDEPKYAVAAAKAADFLLSTLRKDGRLLRSYRKGQARLTGYLVDYAFLIEGLLNLHEATFDDRWLHEAQSLTDQTIAHYYDKVGGAFFYTADDAEKLLARSKQPHDGAIPSGNSVHALNLLRLAALLDRKDYRTYAESILRAFASDAARSPGAYERLLCAADFYHDRVKEIAVIGDPEDPQTRALMRTVYDRYLPNKVVVGSAKPQPQSKMPLLRGKTLKNGRPTAYVCEHYNCQLPVNAATDLAKQLDAK